MSANLLTNEIEKARSTSGLIINKLNDSKAKIKQGNNNIGNRIPPNEILTQKQTPNIPIRGRYYANYLDNKNKKSENQGINNEADMNAKNLLSKSNKGRLRSESGIYHTNSLRSQSNMRFKLNTAKERKTTPINIDDTLKQEYCKSAFYNQAKSSNLNNTNELKKSSMSQHNILKKDTIQEKSLRIHNRKHLTNDPSLFTQNKKIVYEKTIENIINCKKKNMTLRSNNRVNQPFSAMSEKVNQNFNMNIDKSPAMKTNNFFDRIDLYDQNIIPYNQDYKTLQKSLAEIKQNKPQRNSHLRNDSHSNYQVKGTNIYRDVNVTHNDSQKYLCYLKNDKKTSRIAAAVEDYNEIEKQLKKSKQLTYKNKRNNALVSAKEIKQNLS